MPSSRPLLDRRPGTPGIATGDAPRSDDPAILSVGIGEIGLAHAPQCIRTVLGSCVGVIVYDLDLKLAGVAHIMLPNGISSREMPAKYADSGVTELVRQVIAAGGTPSRLKAKIAGGAQMFSRAPSSSLMNIGERNNEAVRNALGLAGIRVVAHDIGGTRGRKLTFNPACGQAILEQIGGTVSFL